MDFSKFQELLDTQVQWPNNYTFKFLVASHKKDELIRLIDDHTVQERFSSSGKYISITAYKEFKSSCEVVAVYQKVSKIEGIISL